MYDVKFIIVTERMAFFIVHTGKALYLKGFSGSYSNEQIEPTL